MENRILVNIGEDHAFECATNIIGREGEGDTTKLEITIPERLCNCSVYLDFEMPSKEKLRTPKLDIESGVAVYKVAQYLLTEKGELKVQLVFVNESGAIWKSSKKRFNILKSINAEDDIPDKQDFITEAQRVLDQLSGEVEEVAERLANDSDFVDSVILAMETPTKVLTISGSVLRFFVGTQAEYNELTNTDNLFAIVTDDTTKEELYQAISDLQEATTQNAQQIKTNGSSLVLLAGEIEAHKMHQFSQKASGTITNGAGVINKALDAGVYLVVFSGNPTRSGVGYFGANTGNLNMYNVMLGDLTLVYGEVAGGTAEAYLVPSNLSWNTALKDGTNLVSESGTLTFYKIGQI